MGSKTLPSKGARKTAARQSHRSVEPPTGLRWLKPCHAAFLMGASRETVYRLCAAGKLPSLKYPGLGIRIDRERLENLLDSSAAPRG